MTVERVFFRDVKPYSVPESLNDLRGPATGILELPHHVFWQRDRVFDLSDPSMVEMAYEALLTEGLIEDQVAGLNRDLLIAMWPNLLLDVRVAQLWEEKFPELRLVGGRALPEVESHPSR